MPRHADHAERVFYSFFSSLLNLETSAFLKLFLRWRFLCELLTQSLTQDLGKFRANLLGDLPHGAWILCNCLHKVVRQLTPIDTLEQIAADPERAAAWLGPLIGTEDTDRVKTLFD